jgi:predicted metal-dependent phosphoesterase TrpH
MNETDLHIHSRYSSDGELSVEDILKKSLEHHISTLAITDHNSVSALDEAHNRCENNGLSLIPGIEIDCTYRGTDLHLLGYQIDWKSPDFVELEAAFHRKVMDSFPAMVYSLAKAGISVNETEVLDKAKGQLPCGELIAEVLLTNPKYHANPALIPYLPGGARSDMPYINFYHDFFAQGKPAYVKLHHMDFRDAVHLVKRNGGIPVVAHPGLNLKGREDMVVELLEQSAEGLEVFNNYHTPAQMEYLAEIAVQKAVWMTCGSDFHGKNKPLIEIGAFNTLPA